MLKGTTNEHLIINCFISAKVYKANFSIYKAPKHFNIIFLIKPVLHFNQFITIVTLSTHTGEKKNTVCYLNMEVTVRGHVRCILWFSSVIPKK